MLFGQGRFVNQQTGYPIQLYDQINQIAIRAWKSIPNKGEVSGNLTKIIQGPMEPFADFVASMDPHGMVKWKDILSGLWCGPDPVLTWARGSVCVFPQDQQDPVWVPERLIRKIQHEEHHECQRGDASAPSHDESTGDGGAEMGDTVSSQDLC
ncbi:Putative Pol polyprotein [Cricetulus griseus]|uniref:Putative Pol polyprotein n=1 Tax=Cricetulus griseus TaxID=10029 RepID=G3IDI7_CRIGR|nr:Putative Pol polyprotein [Cricetulus griseus]